MATIVAVRSGNWSDTSHVTGPWPGGSTPTTKPGTGDTVQTGAYIVTIDEDVHVALLEATGGGYFSVTTAPTLPAVRTIATAVRNTSTEGGGLRIRNPSGRIALIGDVDVLAFEYCYGIHNQNGTMGDITGNVTGGGGDVAYGIYNQGGTIGDITGDVTGGTGAEASGIYSEGGTIGDITGDVTGGAGDASYGINHYSGTMGNITGALVCGTNGIFPIYGSFKMVDNPANSITVISSVNTPLTFSNDYPAEADVKDGVDYNRGTMTGELAAGSVGPVNIVIGGGGIRIS